MTPVRLVSLNARRQACTRSQPLVVALEAHAQPVVVHAQDAFRIAAHRIGPHELHLLRHHADIALVAAVVAEAVEAKTIVEATEERDVVLDADVGAASASTATTATPTAAACAHSAAAATAHSGAAATHSAAATAHGSALTATAGTHSATATAEVARARGAGRRTVSRALSATALGRRLVAATLAPGTFLAAALAASACAFLSGARAFLPSAGALLTRALTVACTLLTGAG